MASYTQKTTPSTRTFKEYRGGMCWFVPFPLPFIPPEGTPCLIVDPEWKIDAWHTAALPATGGYKSSHTSHRWM